MAASDDPARYRLLESIVRHPENGIDRYGRRVARYMLQPLPSYLRTYRRTWALSQRELAELVGDISASNVSKFETLARVPSLEVALAFETVFDVSAEDLFPALSFAVRREVLRNAAALNAQLPLDGDPRLMRKRELLRTLITNLTFFHDASR